MLRSFMKLPKIPPAVHKTGKLGRWGILRLDGGGPAWYNPGIDGREKDANESTDKPGDVCQEQAQL